MKTTRSERDYAFGIAMMTLRTKIGLTQAGLAKHLGITRIAVGKWEGGSSYPNAEHLKELIALGVKSQAFPAGHEAEEIRSFWKSAHQKVLLDEYWLSALLSQQNDQPSDVEPETVGETKSSAPSPLPNEEAGLDRGGGRMVDPLQSPYPPQKISLTPAPTQTETVLHRGDRADLWHKAQGWHKARPLRRRLLVSLIALVVLIVIGSAGTFFFLARYGATGQAYPGYLSGKGTLAFFDPLSREDKWISYTSPTGGSCKFDKEVYLIQQKLYQYLNRCVTSGLKFSKFAFEVQLTITQGDCGGMSFRDDLDGQHFYYFRICQNGMYALFKYAGKDSSPLILLNSRSLAIYTSLGKRNKVAVVASGSTMIFYINEQPVDQVQDSSYTLGYLGLVADPSYNNPTDVVYSNARVWKL